MRIKKLLKNMDKQSREKYENDVFLEEMKSDIAVKNGRRHVYISLFAASLVLIIVAISLICVYSIPKETLYYAQNEIFETATLEEVNARSNEFYITVPDGYRITCEKTVDRESRTLLSYVVSLIDDEDLIKVQIRIIVNQNFIFIVDIEDLTTKKAYDGYSMQYTENIAEDDGIFSFKSRGYIQKNKEKAHISYRELSLDENSGFINLIGNIIKSK